LRIGDASDTFFPARARRDAESTPSHSSWTSNF